MEEVSRFIHNILHQSNLLLVLPQEKWSLHIQIGSKNITIELSRSGIKILENNNNGSELICSEEDWYAMTTGECKLRQCIRLGNTVYKGNFRTLLLLESLLFLQSIIK